MEEVIEGLNIMCTVVEDIISSVAWRGWLDMVVQVIVAKNLVTMLDLGQPRVVLGGVEIYLWIGFFLFLPLQFFNFG